MTEKISDKMKDEGVQVLYLAIYIEPLKTCFEALKRGHKNSYLDSKHRRVMKDILTHFKQECFRVLEGKEAQFPLEE